MNVTTSDEELLRAFVDRGDQAAFRAIVDRHIQAVHAAARRQIRDTQLAEDVAQATFVMLARKAASIRDGAVLGGWLIATARLAAKTTLRGETRRKRREQRAANMSLHNSDHAGSRNDDASAAVDHDDMLERVDAQLDEALARLNVADRTAVTLRDLQSRPLREVAELMGTTEQAAAKRVTRAVAKLKKTFLRRDIDLTPAVLIGALERQSQIDLPAGLADGAFAAATGGNGAAAIAIARDALAASSLRAAAIAASVLLIVAAVITTGAIVYRPAKASTAIVPPVAKTLPTLRVGVYVSHDTAVHRTKEGKPRGWGDQLKILEELQSFPGLDIRPLIEPGTADDAQQAQKLRQYFPGKGAINVANTDALRREVDVILVSAVCEPRDKALSAIEQAVRGGTGLVVRQCLGGHSERLGGYAHPQVLLLRGMHEADPQMIMGRSADVTAEVVAAHPLLGRLSGQSGSKVAMTVYGGYGTFAAQSTGLLEIRNLDPLRHIPDKDDPINPKEGWSFFPAQRRAAREGPNRELQLRRLPHAAGAGPGHPGQVHRQRLAMGGGQERRMM